MSGETSDQPIRRRFMRRSAPYSLSTPPVEPVVGAALAGIVGRMAGRWRLERAGIINVFQYGDETLHFGGGRLLLRGVNGSGKSTAMNMLLPFLLDADVRRIDAAGEQSGVLRSWMLSGREETQPTGYLWLEMTLGDEHLAFGCGIRANRNTDSVNHWWFVTERRPGVDLQLVSRAPGGGRVPLSAEQLRVEIGAESVWTKDQRSSYREALRGRLYGGADLDQHLRLLHIVRNPRVGDRVDVDLPSHLHDALPQLSEASIDDAATPLEQLEEHRRNVAQLTATVRGLEALVEIYRRHARWELRERARAADDQVRAHRRLDGRVREARAAHAQAAEDAQRIGAEVERWGGAVGEHRGEIDALRKRPAYERVIQLDDKRAAVEQLRADAEDSALGSERVDRELDRATEDIAAAGRGAETAGDRFDDAVTDLRGSASAALLDVVPPSRPPVPTGPPSNRSVDADRSADPSGSVDEEGTDDAYAAHGAVDGDRVDEAGSGMPTVPLAPLDDSEPRAVVRKVRAAAQQRSGEIAEVEELLRQVADAAGELRDAERRRERATKTHSESVRLEGEARSTVNSTRDAFLLSLAEWDERLVAHLARSEDLAEVERPLPPAAADVVETHDELVDQRRRLTDTIRAVHTGRIAMIDARLEAERRSVAEARSVVEELAARTVPEPPSVPWQTERRGPSMAEVVDFGADVDAERRRGLEAALEASGLLAAEVRPDGLVTGDGELLVGPGNRVERSLADVLSPAVPDRTNDGDAVTAMVASVLASVSLDPADLDRIDGPDCVIVADGRFRIGPLIGRHAKSTAEHIGVTARREALERQRAEAARIAAEADAAVARSEREHQQVTESLEDVIRLADGLPSTSALVRAIARLESAQLDTERAAALLAEANEDVETADSVHAQRVDLVRRRTAELSLPHDAPALRTAAEACRLVPAHADAVVTALGSLADAVEHWRRAGFRWVEVSGRRRDARARRRRDEQRHRTALTELATLEDQIGLDAAEVLAAIEEADRSLRHAEGELMAARAEEGPASERIGVTRTRVAALGDELDRSEAACRSTLDHLQQAVRVPGLLTAALGDEQVVGVDGDITAAGADRAEVRAPEGGSPADVPRPDGRLGPDRGEDDSVAVPLHGLPVVQQSSAGLRAFARALLDRIPEATQTSADGVRIALRQRRADLGAGWDARDFQPDPMLPLSVEVMGPLGTMPLATAAVRASSDLRTNAALLSAQQDDALRNLLQGMIAEEVALKMHAAEELVDAMNGRLESVRTAHGVGVGLRWMRRDDLSPETDELVDLLRKRPGTRADRDDEARLVETLSGRIDEARRDEPDAPYAALIARIFDYRDWHRMAVMVHRAKEPPERLKRGTALSEGEKKMVSYQPLFAAVAASCDALGEIAPDAPRFVLLDDAFAKVSEDNHPKLFGLLVDLDLDFIATSERLWGTHDTVPELAITEVLRDADAGVIVLEHSHWDGRVRSEAT